MRARAAVQHVLGRTLGDEQFLSPPPGLAQRDGGAPAARVQRQRVDPAQPVVTGEVELPGPVQQRLVDGVGHRWVGVFDAEPGGEVRVAQRLRVGPAQRVEVAGDAQPVQREGTGLVDAQHVHRAEVVDRRQPFGDDTPAAQYRMRADQRGGGDHRQHPGYQADRSGGREQAGLHPGVPGEPGQQQHQRHRGEHEPDKRPGDGRHAAVERTAAAPARQVVVARREVGVGTGGHDHAGGPPADHGRAAQAQPRVVDRCGVREGSGVGQRGVFGDR